ncbi:MAG: transposase [Fibrobacteria bacterium]|nr:transposase [Fibrobacteria bacterium]
MDDKPKRRQYSPEYKLRILQEIDSSREERGSIGRIIRREGLYAAQVALWRRDLEEQIGRGVEARKRGPKPDPTKEVRHEKDRLERQLAKAKEENRRNRSVIPSGIT